MKYKCDRCGREYEYYGEDVGEDLIKVGGEYVRLCESCMFKIATLLKKTDYEWIRDALTRVGYENDIIPHDDKHYFVLNAYGNKIAVEFDRAGEFEKITEAE